MSIRVNLGGSTTSSVEVEGIKPLLVDVIACSIDEGKWTQKRAAEVLKIDQPKISHIKNRRVLSFSLERLFRLLFLLNYTLRITLQSATDEVHIDLLQGENNKLCLLEKVASTIEQRHWTQKHAAFVLKLDQPKVSHIMNRKTLGFSVERLLRFLILLDYNVTLSVHREPLMA